MSEFNSCGDSLHDDWEIERYSLIWRGALVGRRERKTIELQAKSDSPIEVGNCQIKMILLEPKRFTVQYVK